MSNKYDDIIDLKPPVSLRHPRMSLYNRASQFAPFSALVGYDDSIKEAGRITYGELELDDDAIDELNRKILFIKDKIKMHPVVSFNYFLDDNFKNGGVYVSVTGSVKKIDDFNGVIILDNGKRIIISDIIDISGEIFDM